MTAADELRRMLDEADEYYKTSGNKTWWGRPIDRQTGKPINVFHYQAQPMSEDRLFVELQLATPEQAIAATLGSCNCSNDCTNGERTRACLPHFWTHDGTLHIEATRMPTRIVVCEGGTCEFVPKRELDAAEAENAKLRTFISIKETCWKYVGWCDECPYNGVDDEHDDCNCTVREKVSSLARELGVEVDDG